MPEAPSLKLTPSVATEIFQELFNPVFFFSRTGVRMDNSVLYVELQHCLLILACKKNYLTKSIKQQTWWHSCPSWYVLTYLVTSIPANIWKMVFQCNLWSRQYKSDVLLPLHLKNTIYLFCFLFPKRTKISNGHCGWSGVRLCRNLLTGWVRPLYHTLKLSHRKIQLALCYFVPDSRDSKSCI